MHTTDAGSIVRLKDVARVELGAQTYNFEADARRQADGADRRSCCSRARTRCETGGAIEARLEELSADFPKGMAYDDSVRHASST